MNGDVIFVDATEPFVGVQIGLQLLQVHDPGLCEGQACCIHHPSAHHMVGWRQNWRADRRQMERVCPHGTGHPDPDDLNPDGAHGCDGCCAPPPADGVAV